MATSGYKLTFWGVRGTVATPFPNRLRYGGNTPCATIEIAADEHVVLDCGTGMRLFGNAVASGRAGQPMLFHVLLSHYHFDHVEGLSLFQPLYDPASTIVFHGFVAEGRTIQANLETLIAPPYFPLRLSGVPATVQYRDVDGSAFMVADLRIDTIPLSHPDGSVAYRVDHGGRRLVFATDHEYGDERIDKALIEFARGAEYLIYDATYMPAEYASLRKGWGHSTWFAGVEAARAAGVKTLILFHHHPEHTDDQLDEVERISREEFPATFVAREGMELAF